MDFAGLAYYDKKDSKLKKHTTGSRELRFPLRFYTKKAPEKRMPAISYGPIEMIAIRLVEAYQNDQRIDLSDFNRSSISKSLTSLEALGFIRRQERNILLNQKLFEFANSPRKRSRIFRSAVLQNESFKTFIKILEQNKGKKLNLMTIGKKLSEELKKDWRPITAKSYAKILLNWAKNCKALPSETTRGIQMNLIDFEI